MRILFVAIAVDQGKTQVPKYVSKTNEEIT